MSLLNVLTQPLVLVGGVALICTVGIVVYLRRGGDGGSITPSINSKSRKRIIVLQPRDKRAYELNISKERELTLETKKDNIERRYYKAGPGYTLPNGSTLFFGLEGTAYTGIVADDKSQNMSLPDALSNLWGAEVYKNTPTKLKDPIEKIKWGVTIVPEKIEDEDKHPHVNVENINDEKKEKLVSYVAKAVKEDNKMNWQTFLFGGAAFSAGTLILLMVTGHLKM